MEHGGQQGNAYKQLAEEIGAVLQSAAETAEKMLDDARAEAARIQEVAEGDRRIAFAEGRRILDEARMEADMVRAEADWQSQEIVAQARRQAAERLAAADARLAELNLAESRMIDRLAGVGQMLAEAMAGLRSTAPDSNTTSLTEPETPVVEAEDDQPTAKVYFVEFPPPAPAIATPEPEREIVLTDAPPASEAATEHSEWAPPPDMPVWWTRGATEG